MMGKICFITTGDIRSIATAKRALGLAVPMAELGWEVSILMQDTEENRHRASMECDGRIEVRFFSVSGIGDELAWKRRQLIEISPDIVYLCAFVMRNMVRCGGHVRRVVEHSELQSGILDRKNVKHLLSVLMEYGSIFYADALINASKYLNDVFRSKSSRMFRAQMPMLYLPYAYNPSLSVRREVDWNDSRFSWLRGKKVFIFMGTITRNYGVFTILEAVEKLSHERDDFHVIMMGRGRHLEDARLYATEHGLDNMVSLPGYVAEEELPDYFSLSSAFLSPMNDSVQDWARCPSKLYMYLPYERPIITCEIGEPYEVLGEAGLYYAPGDAGEMAERMKDVLAGRSGLGVNASLHSWRCRATQLNGFLWSNFRAQGVKHP